MSDEDKALKDWFTNRPFSATPYQVNSYIRTDNLANMIELALFHLEHGSKTSRIRLIDLKAKLEEEESHS